MKELPTVYFDIMEFEIFQLNNFKVWKGQKFQYINKYSCCNLS